MWINNRKEEEKQRKLRKRKRIQGRDEDIIYLHVQPLKETSVYKLDCCLLVWV
jgi:hypothetical protein